MNLTLFLLTLGLTMMDRSTVVPGTVSDNEIRDFMSCFTVEGVSHYNQSLTFG